MKLEVNLRIVKNLQKGRQIRPEWSSSSPQNREPPFGNHIFSRVTLW